jgi:hypothetical protein
LIQEFPFRVLLHFNSRANGHQLFRLLISNTIFFTFRVNPNDRAM